MKFIGDVDRFSAFIELCKAFLIKIGAEGDIAKVLVPAYKLNPECIGQPPLMTVQADSFVEWVIYHKQNPDKTPAWVKFDSGE